jgi:hypothetical protein
MTIVHPLLHLEGTFAPNPLRLPHPLKFCPSVVSNGWSHVFLDVSGLSCSLCFTVFLQCNDPTETRTPLAIIPRAKVVVYVFVFTIPLLLVGTSPDAVWANRVAIFLLTYCFIGLELIAEELEGPVENQVGGFE